MLNLLNSDFGYTRYDDAEYLGYSRPQFGISKMPFFFVCREVHVIPNRRTETVDVIP